MTMRERGGLTDTAGPVRPVTARRRALPSVLPALFAGVSGLLVLVSMVVFSGIAVGPVGRGWYSDLLLVLTAATMTVCCARTAVRSTAQERIFWSGFALAGLFWTVGEAGSSINEHFVAHPSDPSWADLFYLLAVVPAAVAMATVPAAGKTGRERAISLLACLVGAASLVFIGHSIRLALGVVQNMESLADTVATAYPVTDVVLIALALITLIRSGGRARRRLVLVMVGVTAIGVADTCYGVQYALGDYRSGSLVDVGWAVGYLLVALAALSLEGSGPAVAVRRDPAWLAALIYLPVLSAAVVAAVIPEIRHSALLVVAGVLVLVSFGVRQLLLAQEHVHVNQQREEQLLAAERAGAQLRRQVAETRLITESVPDGIVVLDDRFRLLMLNEPARQLLGVTADGLTGAELATLLDRDDPAAEKVMAAVREGHTVSAVDTAVRHGASSVAVAVTVGPIEENGHRVGTVVVLRDITARKAVERMKNEFISVVSHELRTPLTSIRGSLALLDGGMGGSIGPTGQRMVTLALQSSDRLARLIDDLLDMERMEAGRVTMVFEPCEASALVDQAMREMRGLAQSRGVQLVRLEAVGTVRADADRIVQTLTNLISNAVKFSETGSEIRLSALPDGAEVEFCVADDGRGIPEDKRQAVFERFEQVDSSDSRQKGGTGLGLAICRNIVQRHGGRIWVDSELGRGSEFRFRLPAVSATDRGPGGRPAAPSDGPDTGEATDGGPATDDEDVTVRTAPPISVFSD